VSASDVRAAEPPGPAAGRRGRRRWLLGAALAATAAAAWVFVDLDAPYGLSESGKTVATLPGRLVVAVHDPHPPRWPVELGPTPPPGATTAAELRERGLAVERLDNPAPPVRPDFAFQSVADPALAELRERYGLAEVVAGCAGDLEALAALSTWTKSRWVYDEPSGTLHVADARTLLEAAEAGQRFFCAHYCYVLIQALAAVGFQARCLRLESESGGIHAVVEAWSDDLQRWVLLDPTHDGRYERDGVPLDAAELQRAWREGSTGGIAWVPGPPIEYPDGARHDPREPEAGPPRLPLFARVFVCGRNDFLSHAYPMWHPRYFGNRWQGLWRELSGRDRWPLNQTWIVAVDAAPDAVEVRLGTCTPNFEAFLTAVDDGPWREAEPTLRWRLHPGRNVLRARSRNALGRTGRVATLVVDGG